ncbi:hypothetical protein ES703_39403 [subsurface metagenome]
MQTTYSLHPFHWFLHRIHTSQPSIHQAQPLLAYLFYHNSPRDLPLSCVAQSSRVLPFSCQIHVKLDNRRKWSMEYLQIFPLPRDIAVLPSLWSSISQNTLSSYSRCTLLAQRISYPKNHNISSKALFPRSFLAPLRSPRWLPPFFPYPHLLKRIADPVYIIIEKAPSISRMGLSL